jgi:Asp-tRNA(Asn)/Glu-tRNA(Gln) amidotransferase A subunit family amidase
VPRQGLLPLAQSFDTVGWLTRDSATLQRVADWCLGYEGSESTESPYGRSEDDLPWRLLVVEEALAAVEPETRRAFEALLDQLASSPDAPSIATVSIGPLDGYFEPFRTVQGAEAWRNNGDWVRAHRGALGPAVAERFRQAALVTPEQEAAARTEVARLQDVMRGHVQGAVLAMPTVPGPAPMRTRDGGFVDAVRANTLRMTTPAAIGGLPSLSAPLLAVDSLLGPAPVGVCLTSAEGTDIALVRAARRLERTLI